MAVGQAGFWDLEDRLRRDAGRRAPSAQHRWGEAGYQGWQVGPGELAFELGQSAAEGCRRPLDDEGLESEAAGEDKPLIDIAIPAFGYKSHVSIDRRHGIIRRGLTTDAAAHDGARLREGLIDPNNTASDVWADSAYRSKTNEAFLEKIGKVSRIHRRKPAGKPMPRRTARSNAAKSAVRAAVEHPFAHMKGCMGLTIRTIGLKRAEAAITLANMAYNMRRWCWLERKYAGA